MQVTTPMPLVSRMLTHVRTTGLRLTQRLLPLTSASRRQAGPPTPHPVPVVRLPVSMVDPVFGPLWHEYTCDQAEALGFTAFKYAGKVGKNDWMAVIGDIAIAHLGTKRDAAAVAAAASFESVIKDRALVEFATPEVTAVLELQMSADHAADFGEPIYHHIYEVITAEGWHPCEIDAHGRVAFPETGPRLGRRTWSLDKLLCAHPPVSSTPAYYAIPISIGPGQRRNWSPFWALRQGSHDQRLKYLVAEVNPDEKRVYAVQVKDIL